MSNEDTTIDLVRAYEQAQQGRRLRLTAGENVPSPHLIEALRSSLSARYATASGPGEGNAWGYPSAALPWQIIQKAEHTALEVFRGAHADLRPASGIVATHILLSALLRPGDSFLAMAPEDGAHFTTEEIAVFKGYNRVNIPSHTHTKKVNMAGTVRTAEQNGAKLIFFDPSMLLDAAPIAKLRKELPHIVIAYDASHPLGLIGGGAFPNPLDEGADLLIGGTHKTLPGPQGGLIISARKPQDHNPTRLVFENIERFEVNYKPGRIAALGVALEEIRDFGESYARESINNSRLLGQILSEQGLDIARAANGEFTNTHQVHIILGDRAVAEKAVNALEDAHIDTNATRIPFSKGRFGLRIGLAGITRLGMNREGIIRIANLIADTVLERRPAGSIREDVMAIAAAHTATLYTHRDPDQGQGRTVSF